MEGLLIGYLIAAGMVLAMAAEDEEKKELSFGFKLIMLIGGWITVGALIMIYILREED